MIRLTNLKGVPQVSQVSLAPKGNNIPEHMKDKLVHQTVPKQIDDKLELDEMLILNLLMRNRIGPAPWKTIRSPDTYQIFVALGKDNTAEITVSEEGLRYLGIEPPPYEKKVKRKKSDVEKGDIT